MLKTSQCWNIQIFLIIDLDMFQSSSEIYSSKNIIPCISKTCFWTMRSRLKNFLAFSFTKVRQRSMSIANACRRRINRTKYVAIIFGIDHVLLDDFIYFFPVIHLSICTFEQVINVEWEHFSSLVPWIYENSVKSSSTWWKKCHDIDRFVVLVPWIIINMV